MGRVNVCLTIFWTPGIVGLKNQWQKLVHIRTIALYISSSKNFCFKMKMK